MKKLLLLTIFLTSAIWSYAQQYRNLRCPAHANISVPTCHNTDDGSIELIHRLDLSYEWRLGNSPYVFDTTNRIADLDEGTYWCTMTYHDTKRVQGYTLCAADELKTGRQPRFNPIPVGTNITINPSGGSGPIYAVWIHFNPITGQRYFVYGGFPLLTSYTPMVPGILHIQCFSNGCIDNKERLLIQ